MGTAAAEGTAVVEDAAAHVWHMYVYAACKII